MTTSNKTIEKADAALEIILKHDVDDSFKQILCEILNRWRDLE